MTRIIAGFAGSLRLEVPKFGTRPTSDRVREAIFSALEARDAIDGARVLDLYAGSGALGLEAASRGAAHVTLVDKSWGVTKIAQANAAHVKSAAPRGTAPEIVVSGHPAQSFLGSAGQAGDRWDVVFLDPPYELGGLELVHNLEALVRCLNPDAVVVVERSSRDRAPEWPDGLELDRRKDYGDTALYWLGPAATAGGAGDAGASSGS